VAGPVLEVHGANPAQVGFDSHPHGWTRVQDWSSLGGKEKNERQAFRNDRARRLPRLAVALLFQLTAVPGSVRHYGASTSAELRFILGLLSAQPSTAPGQPRFLRR
jgi:hypothetical protein